MCVSVSVCRAESLQLHFDLELCHLAAGTDANALRSQRRDWQRRLNTQIQNIALELVVNIFRYSFANVIEINDYYYKLSIFKIILSLSLSFFASIPCIWMVLSVGCRTS